MPKFPGPYIENVPENDPMVVRVDLKTMETGARRSAMPKSIKNTMTIKHVKGR